MQRSFPRPLLTAAMALVTLLLFACSERAPAQEPTTGAPVSKEAEQQNGRVVKSLPDGGRIEGVLRDGKREGQWFSYFAHGGPRSSITYVNGLEQGKTEVFHESGLTYYTGQYHAGKEVGTWIFYDEDGTELKRAVYDSTGVLLEQRAP